LHTTLGFAGFEPSARSLQGKIGRTIDAAIGGLVCQAFQDQCRFTEFTSGQEGVCLP
jgi:hypothetical protein